MVRRNPSNDDRQPDLFAASFADIPVRDQRDTMERPFFSLAKRPRLDPIEYQVGDVWVEVSPNPQFGMATIWDADILIWASTQITEALDRGMSPSRTIQFHPYNLLKSIRRTTGGADYTRLRAALERLTHTAVRTNIRGDGRKKFASFHWLESWTETTDEQSGEPTGMTITLPDWLYDGIVERGGVLTIHEDYQVAKQPVLRNEVYLSGVFGVTSGWLFRPIGCSTGAGEALSGRWGYARAGLSRASRSRL